MSESGLRQAHEAMATAGVHELPTRVFEHYYRQLESGERGVIPEGSIEPLHDVEELQALSASEAEQEAALAGTVVIKLNGGLGTSMGLEGPKTALAVHDGLTFLDVIARQVLALRRRFDVRLPLVLMNSFRTREQSLQILQRYPELVVEGLPLDFLQSQEPKLRAEDLTPVQWPDDPDLQWCPPGHGDVYVSLLASGLLEQLREHGFHQAFISNGDNLGATCDPDLAVFMQRHHAPFVAEVCRRTPNDRKGGHLARRRADGRIVLREAAMVTDDDMDAFQDIDTHQCFNTNSVWVDLDALAGILQQRDGVLGLPMIVNRKTVDPTRKDSTPVIQIESAMGAAIEVFDGAEAVQVPRTRFRPVKTTNELLLVRSDRFHLDEHADLVATTDGPDPRVALAGPYTLLGDFERRFPHGAPSLRECTALQVDGDVTFGAGVSCVGDVAVTAANGPATIADGARLTGTVTV